MCEHLLHLQFTLQSTYMWWNMRSSYATITIKPMQNSNQSANTNNRWYRESKRHSFCPNINLGKSKPIVCHCHKFIKHSDRSNGEWDCSSMFFLYGTENILLYNYNHSQEVTVIRDKTKLGKQNRKPAIWLCKCAYCLLSRLFPFCTKAALWLCAVECRKKNWWRQWYLTLLVPMLKATQWANSNEIACVSGDTQSPQSGTQRCQSEFHWVLTAGTHAPSLYKSNLF